MASVDAGGGISRVGFGYEAPAADAAPQEPPPQTAASEAPPPSRGGEAPGRMAALGALHGAALGAARSAARGAAMGATLGEADEARWVDALRETSEDTALAAAIALRHAEDPPMRTGDEVTWFSFRELLRPIARSPEALPGLVERFAGREIERAALPEFHAARTPEGWSIREHLLNAIYINADRMGYYASQAGPARRKSLGLSRKMVVYEWFSQLGVLHLDAQADDMRALGVPPLVDDLLPLVPLPRETPPTYRGVATKAQLKTVQGRVDKLIDDVREALEDGDLGRVSDLCYAAQTQVARWEEEWGVHWAMTKHTIGSVGYAALRGAKHAHVPERKELSIGYLKTLLNFTLRYGTNVDRKAQPIQAQGVGIVVNDFTGQPFIHAYERGET